MAEADSGRADEIDGGRSADRAPRLPTGPGRAYRGADVRHVALPLGGIGAGHVALCGDGSLRQWQMVNQVNHLGFVPDSFFLLRACAIHPPLDVTRILISREAHTLPADTRTPWVNDDYIPADQRALVQRFGGVERTVFVEAYPFAHVTYEDAEIPLDVELEAYSPFVPLDAVASGLPAILFTFRLRNPSAHDVQGCLGATLQNAVGWDGLTPIENHRCPLYGGHVNRIRRGTGYTAIVMENPSLAEDDPRAGQMVLATTAPDVRAHPRWTAPAQFVAFASLLTPERPPGAHAEQRLRKIMPEPAAGPSRAGETWNGGLLVPYWLAPGEQVEVTFAACWHFPNRYVNFEQFRFRDGYRKSRFWLGNAYAARFPDAVAVLEDVLRHRQARCAHSRAWASGLYESTLPGWAAGLLGAQSAAVRSPTCFWTEDGRFYGFEGALGASSAVRHGSAGGSCPLNCTHVWNYEQTLSRLFPGLERTMRETELEHVLAPDGSLPHRTVLPLYLPQYRDEPIGGPAAPALDGMLGAPLKLYREVRQGAPLVWLERLWPGVKRLMTYVAGRWDPDRDGLLAGDQPNTYDIAFVLPNMYIGALWLAALRATETLARLLGDEPYGNALRTSFDMARDRYDELLWNGEYYAHTPAAGASLGDQIGPGCLATQLLGQWWADQLDLGHLLPAEHIRSALRSIVRYNFRRGFHEPGRAWRLFADGDDAGLVNCSWPRGDRPAPSMRYADEVWTGVEYQVSAQCLREGLVGEGVEIATAARDRYTGARRNPYNEIECGDHYARAMAGWSVYEAFIGFRYNAVEDALRFDPVGTEAVVRCPFVAGSGWGTYAHRSDNRRAHVTIACAFGDVRIRRLHLPIAVPGDVRATAAGIGVPVRRRFGTDGVALECADPVLLTAGNSMTVIIG